MTNQQRVLEYQVRPDGTVATNGHYRVVTEREWVTMPEVRTKKQLPYITMLSAICNGQIVAVAVSSRKQAWDKINGLRKAAQRQGVAVQTKVVVDPEQPNGFLVLARLG